MIHVIGDIILDKYIKCSATRLSPEAPIPVLTPDEIFYKLGGASNVALNVSSFSSSVNLYGIAGVDDSSRILSKLLKLYKIPNFINREKGEITIKKSRYIVAGQQVVRVDDERFFKSESAQKAFNFVKTNAKQDDILIISDYAKGTVANVEEIISFCNFHSIKSLIDPKGDDFYKYSGAFMLTPNMKEFETIAGTSESEEEFHDKAFRLRRDLNIEYLLVTRGEKGMTLFGDEEAWTSNAIEKKITDVTGAGDTVIATIAFLLSKGVNIQLSCELANYAASSVVTEHGSAVPSLTSITNIFVQAEIEQIQTRQASLIGKIENARKQQKKIAFTNGCFDLLHAGHLRLLNEAKGIDNFVVVGINTDQSISKIKGPDRPVNSLTSRMAALEEMPNVDLVVPFDEPTPLDLIKKIKPDLLIKGGDYNPDEIVGSDFVQSYGGCIKCSTYLPGFSTTSIIKKLEAKK